MPGDATEDFRCKSCDRILTQSDEFDLSTCRDCEWRPAKHAFDESPDGTCQTCGYLFTFGALHEVPQPAVEDDPPVRGCPRCQHFSHVGPCPDALPAFPRNKPCLCQGEQVKSA